MKNKNILLEHGGGGLLTHELVETLFLRLFDNKYLRRMEDSAVFEIAGNRFCFTTDSYVVHPLFFPGGDIGSLAIHGTVNDLAMCGGTPLYLSAGFILEEGFPMEILEKIVQSMTSAAARASVQIVTGDTKVVSRGAADGLFINTSGIGLIRYQGEISVSSINTGDVIIINGSIGDHGAAVLCARENLGLDTSLLSDSAPLNGLVELILKTSPHVHCMRDITRGGLGTILSEISLQSQFMITLEEQNIPICEAVRGFSEMLGIDPLYLANEGKMVVFCPEADAAKILETMHTHPLGKDAAIIGEVKEKGTGRLLMKTVIGGTRMIDLPTGELVPRIC